MNILQLSPPGYHKRTTNPRDLGPIKREEGHSQPRVHAEQLVDDDVVRGCPAYERKDRERLEKIACSVNRQLSGLRTRKKKEHTRQKEEEKTPNEHDNEMPIPRHRPLTPSPQHTNTTTTLLRPTRRPEAPLHHPCHATCSTTYTATKFCGHTILAGQTKNLLHNPASPNPVNCVASTSTSWNQ
jgi:hypothetical protein